MKKQTFRNYISAVLLVILVLVPALDCVAAERVFPKDDNLVIVIDPGHGGTDTGTQGGRIQERFMNLMTGSVLRFIHPGLLHITDTAISSETFSITGLRMNSESIPGESRPERDSGPKAITTP